MIEDIRKLMEDEDTVDVSGHSLSKTYMTKDHLFIKTDLKGSLKEEHEMALAFNERGIGPEVVTYLSDDRDYLVSRKARGEDLTGLVEDPDAVVRIMASSLRHLHSLSAEGIPLSSRQARYLNRLADPFNGYYDEEVLLSRFRTMTKKEAADIILKNGHELKDDIFIHGDACLPNIMHENKEFSSFIDPGMAGRGDRHIDIYWALWSIEYNLKDDRYGESFLDLYGRKDVSEETLELIAAFEMLG